MARNSPVQSQRKDEKKNATPMPDDVDKIRDIIFGGQMREYSERFEQLEKMIKAKFERLAADIDKRFEQLSENLAAERKERESVVEGADEKLRKAHERIEQELNQAEERFVADTTELRSALGEGHQELFSIIEKVKEDLSASMASETARLERHKVAVGDLAQLFADVARDLKKQSK